ncbi:MAG: integrating conjugative element protein [Gammaproteobacteria bacterium]|nr:integrating conjugative element protein [Gammaproteobacteria bacterium]
MNHPAVIPWVIAVLCWSMSSPVFAELVVIHDSGQTRPLEPLLDPLLSDAPQPDEIFRAEGSPSPDLDPGHISGEGMLTQLLPVRSPGLQPGALVDTVPAPGVRTRLAQANPRPFFLVGSDPFSLRWLVANAKTLRETGAAGLLVQAETVEDVRRVGEAGWELSITPGSGNDLARALGIRRYPILITRDGFMQ